MDSKVKLYLERAENEFRLAKAMFNLSIEEEMKVKLEANPTDTFYSAVISHCYYSIFYSVKAALMTKGMETSSPEVHKRTFEKFKLNFVDNGELDVELLKIYNKEG